MIGINNLGGDGGAKAGIIFDKVNENGEPTSVKIKFNGNIPKGYNNMSGGFYSLRGALNNCNKIEISCNGIIYDYAFAWAFYECQSNTKLKIKDGVTALKQQSLAYGFNGKSGVKIYVPESVTEIAGNGASNGAFISNPADTRIYCGANSKPGGYGYYWDNYNNSTGKMTVTWGVTEEQFDAL